MFSNCFLIVSLLFVFVFLDCSIYLVVFCLACVNGLSAYCSQALVNCPACHTQVHIWNQPACLQNHDKKQKCAVVILRCPGQSVNSEALGAYYMKEFFSYGWGECSVLVSRQPQYHGYTNQWEREHFSSNVAFKQVEMSIEPGYELVTSTAKMITSLDAVDQCKLLLSESQIDRHFAHL